MELYSDWTIGGKPAALAPARVERLKQFLDGVPTAAWLDPVARAPYLEKMGAEAQAIGETFAIAFPKERPWDAYIAALRASVAALAAGAAKGRKIGSLGFCMGGALSLRLACVEPALAAAALFYGIGPPADLLDGLRAPVLGLYAEDDPRITPTVPALAEALRAHGKSYVYEVFPGTRHAFHNDTRNSYHPEASRQAWARTLSFLARHLS
jgi:carboxymethylenebutenolidase